MPRPSNLTIARYVLAVLAALGLAYDAYVHFDLASNYDPITTAHLSQGDLFRAEGVVAILAAVLILARPRRWTAAVAAVVGGSALAVLLAYRYKNIGQIGPIPSMYEPIWFPEKTRSGYAEGLAFLAALGLAALPRVAARHTSEADAHPADA